MKPLWGGRFRRDNDAAFESFNASFPFDQRLLTEELAASTAYGAGLARAGVLTADEWKSLSTGLATMASEAAADPAYTAAVSGCEDVHTFVEGRLRQLCGDVAAKIHTGRSRNEQTATNLRLFVKAAAGSTQAALQDLRQALAAHAEKHAELLIPGYTHLQRAQPLLWSHYLLGYAAQLGRDHGRFGAVAAAADLCPLGSGALAGNSFGLDRPFVAAALGFGGITSNSLDATSDRDFVSDYLHAASLAMVHLSRMAEDLIIFSTHEFGFLELGDEVTTGSSLMPQKKNPDALELIRGKSGRVIGHLTGLLCTLKGLPSGYNKDLQEDKEALFDTVDTVQACLRVMTTVIQTMEPKGAVMAAAAATGFLNATELAEYLVKKGLAFRAAHEVVGQIVLHAQDEGKLLADLTLAEMKGFAAEIGADVYAALTADAAVRAKGVPGGTAPQAVAAALAALQRSI